MSEARYRLTDRIGAGELADSFRGVRDESLAVEIKLFQPGTADERYARELAEVARRLLPFETPGIIQVIDIGLVAGRLAVVREAVDGLNLGQLLARLSTWRIIFPTPLALWILSELLEIMHRAHAAGAVHGGITPGNTFLCADAQPALCDFGALQALAAVPELNEVFVPGGRGSYRSWEVERGEPATQQSDVFSLGAVAYQLLTLREISSGRAKSTLAEPSPAISSQIDQRLYPILMKSMETIPQLRYRSCADFAEALHQYLPANQLARCRHELQKFLRDLFPEGMGLRRSGDPLPFTEPFSLQPIRDLAPLQKPSRLRTPWPAPFRSAGPQGRPSQGAASGFEGAWYGAPDSESESAAAGPRAGRRDDPNLFTPIGRMTVAEHLSAPAPAPQPEPSFSELERRAQLAPKAEAAARRTTGRPLVGFGTALVFAGCLALAILIWRPGRSGADRGQTAAAPEVRPPTAGPSSSAQAQAPEPAPDPMPPPPTASLAPRPERPIEWDSPPRKGGGFVSVWADVPAIVYIDGRRVRQPAPLKRYPVQVGVRKISIVAADTRQRRDFILRFNQGQVRKLDEVFDRSSDPR